MFKIKGITNIPADFNVIGKIKKIKPRFVQLKNPKNKNYIRIDTLEGKKRRKKKEDL